MKKISKEIMKAIIAVIGIIIGLGISIFLKEILAGSILTVIGTMIIGMDEKLRNSIIPILSLLFGRETDKKVELTMEKSPNGIQQLSKGDSYAAHGNIIFNLGNLKSEDYEKRIVLKKIYEKMIEPYSLLNKAANNGIESKENFEKISKAIEDFRKIKILSELELNEEIKIKLSKLMGAFRFTSHELFLKVQKDKFNEGLNGEKSFDFLERFEEVKEEIKKILNKK